jgi:hypothetical protein
VSKPTLILLYTDPGTGAMLWQLMVAAFIGAAFYFRHYAAKIKLRFKTSRAKGRHSEQPNI